MQDGVVSLLKKNNVQLMMVKQKLQDANEIARRKQNNAFNKSKNYTDGVSQATA